MFRAAVLACLLFAPSGPAAAQGEPAEPPAAAEPPANPPTSTANPIAPSPRPNADEIETRRLSEPSVDSHRDGNAPHPSAEPIQSASSSRLCRRVGIASGAAGPA